MKLQSKKATAKTKTAKPTAAAKPAAPKKAAAPAPERPAKAAPAAKPAKERKPTVASTARAMVIEGKTNEEILAVLRRDFALPDDHVWFVGWYRNQTARKGLVTKEFAKAHAHAPKAKEAP